MTTATLTSTKELQQRLDFFEQECRRRGLRVTEQRREIFKTVASSHSHPSAEDVFAVVREKMSNVSLDTVYRTLASLADMELILRVGTAYKERFDGDLRPHAHFICSDCGEVYDIFYNLDHMMLPLQEAFSCGDVRQINLQYKGLCKQCQEKRKSGTVSF